MRQYDAHNLIIHPGNPAEPGVIVQVLPEQAGWEYVHFQVRELAAQGSWAFATGEYELAIVVLGGTIRVESERGRWQQIGERETVFRGPYASS